MMPAILQFLYLTLPISEPTFNLFRNQRFLVTEGGNKMEADVVVLCWGMFYPFHDQNETVTQEKQM